MIPKKLNKNIGEIVAKLTLKEQQGRKIGALWTKDIKDINNKID